MRSKKDRNLNKSYNVNDIAVVSCYFNPCHYKSRLKNYKIFREGIVRTGVRFLTVELAFGDDDFELSSFPEAMQLRTSKKNIMWQKERLLNIGIKKLIDEGYKKIAWLDADIIFDDDSWVEKISEALDKYNVVQVFGEAEIDQTQKEYRNIKSSVKYLNESGIITKELATPGGAWAANSKILKSFFLYESCIVTGENDSLFMYGCYYFDKYIPQIKKEKVFVKQLNSSLLIHYLKWAKRLGSIIRGKVGYLDIKIKTLYHGEIKNRGYFVTSKIYRKYNYNPSKDIKTGKNGCLEWASNKPKFHKKVRDYFYSRKEDD